jgi:hypothetical protein
VRPLVARRDGDPLRRLVRPSLSSPVVEDFVIEEDEMNADCQCGMTLEHERARKGCRECGTAVCRSCSLKVEANTYCRWCATSQALIAAA